MGILINRPMEFCRVVLTLTRTSPNNVPAHSAMATKATKRTVMILPLLLAACAAAPQQRAERLAKPAAQPEQAAKAPALPNIELSEKLLYKFLLGEVAEQRGDSQLAAQTYLDLARTTRDPRVARRAAQLAFESRQLDKSLEAFKLWQELEPDSLVPKQMLATLLVTSGRLNEARPYLKELLAASPDAAGTTFVQLYPLLERVPDKAGAYKLLSDLAQPYPQVAEAHWAVAQGAAAAGKYDEALKEAQRAHELRADWDAPVLLEARLLMPNRPKEALAVLKDFLASNADADEVRLLYARMLLEMKEYKESRDQFQRLLVSHPDNSELAFAVALLSLQLGELDRAEKGLQDALVKGKKDQNTVYYYLGQLSEARKDTSAAISQYRKVQDGEYLFPARLRLIYLLSTQGKLDEARQILHETRAQNGQQRAQLVLIEAQLLREAQQFEAAYAVVQQGLESQPNNPDLLYEGALLADRVGKPDELEKLVRKLIQLQPDNASAYNVLGYSLLERNVRLQEGMKLVEKAYELAPTDAAIMDSVGWGHYRLGNLDKSLEFLRRAFAANPDPEIAAHLGEVLWVHGEKQQAKKVWNDSLKLHPDSAPLQAVIKKFMP